MRLSLFVATCVLVMTTIATPLFAEDIDCLAPANECGVKPGGCSCPAGSLPELVSSSGEDVIVGTRFAVSGGRAPYHFTFDGGSLENYDDGNPATNDANIMRIASVNDCGTSGDSRWATVTVTDACGQPKKIEVRLPQGGWAFRGREEFPEYNNYAQSTQVETTIGGKIYREYWNLSTYQVNKAYKPAYNGNPSSCSRFGLMDEYNANGFCCIPDIVTRPFAIVGFPGSNSMGTYPSPSFANDDGCYSYDLGSVDLSFRCHTRDTFEWVCQ